MWPIWEWFVDADSYAAWADRSVASPKVAVSFGSEPPGADGDGNVASIQSKHLPVASEPATAVTL